MISTAIPSNDAELKTFEHSAQALGYIAKRSEHQQILDEVGATRSLLELVQRPTAPPSVINMAYRALSYNNLDMIGLSEVCYAFQAPNNHCFCIFDYRHHLRCN